MLLGGKTTTNTPEHARFDGLPLTDPEIHIATGNSPVSSPQQLLQALQTGSEERLQILQRSYVMHNQSRVSRNPHDHKYPHYNLLIFKSCKHTFMTGPPASHVEGQAFDSQMSQSNDLQN